MVRDTGVFHECRLRSHPVQSPPQWAAFARNGETIFVVTLVNGRKLAIEKKLADDVVEEIVRAFGPCKSCEQGCTVSRFRARGQG